MTSSGEASISTGGGKACLTILGSYPSVILGGSANDLTLENIASGNNKSSGAVFAALGFDSTGANEGGWVSSHFTNDAFTVSSTGNNGPTFKVGQNSFQNYMDHTTLATDCNQNPGTDAGANLVINAGSGNTASFGWSFTDNWWYCGGGIKYYAPNTFYTIRVRNLDIEASNTNVEPAVWFALSSGVGGPCLDCEIEGIELQDYFGSRAVPAVQNDNPGPFNLIVMGVAGYKVNCVGSMICEASDSGNTGITEGPQQQGQAGFFNGHVVGATDITSRDFSSTAVRFNNLAITDMSSVTNSGSTTFTTGITAPDGTSGAAQFASTSGTQYAYTFPLTSETLSVGEFLIAKVWIRSQTANGFVGNNPLLIVVSGKGAGAACNSIGPINEGDGEWELVWKVCRVTAAPSNPYYVGMYVGYSTSQTIQIYAPIFNIVPAHTISTNEAYAYANALISYDGLCVVGTICGLTGQKLVESTFGTLSNCSSNSSPAACGSASAGSVVVAAGATSVFVKTSAVTANSQIILTFDSSLGKKLGVTCNTTFDQGYVTARAPGLGFTITASAPTANPACFSYQIIN
jgi:hypothetical protein